MRGLFLATGLLLFAGSADAGADCTCRHRGGAVAEGETACLNTAEGAQLARCEKFLNNTSWKFLDRPCPTAAIEPTLSTF